MPTLHDTAGSRFRATVQRNKNLHRCTLKNRNQVAGRPAGRRSMTSAADFLDIGQGELSRRIAVRMREGAGPDPGLVWLGGFMSDMGGTKAAALDHWAGAHGRACLRFDYSGHGESGGRFADGTIGRWLEESLAVFDARCAG